MDSRTVLVADDNVAERARAAATLEAEGYRVVVVADGDDALAATVAERPDCVLVNVALPKLDGLTACERIRAMPRGDEIAIILASARRDAALFDRALAAGGDDLVTKPFQPTDLIVRVQVALQWRRRARDRTELDALLKSQRDRLRRLELARQQLVELFVHDLKAPVTVTDLHAQLIERCVDDRETVLASARRIKAETRALSSMIMNLLDLSQADQAQLQASPSELDARSLVRDVIDELAIVANESSVTIAAEIHAATIWADRDLLVRVLANLLDNAIRHSPKGGRIRVEIVERDHQREIRVSDEGPGIHPHLRTEAFEWSTSAGNATRWNRGLGLAFCKLAVEAHGGQIWIEDASPGAVFCVRI